MSGPFFLKQLSESEDLNRPDTVSVFGIFVAC